MFVMGLSHSKYIFIIFVSILSLSAHSQGFRGKSYFLAGSQGSYGYVMTKKGIPDVVSSRPYGFDMSLSRLRTDYESWKVFQSYNITGIQVGYYNFQNPSITGSAYTMTIFTEPVFGRFGRMLISVRAGGGLSFMTRIYDPEKNPFNTMVSSKLSIPLNFSARIRYLIASKWFLTASGSFNHISNGAVRKPNNGMNFPVASLGIEYSLDPVPRMDLAYVPDEGKKTKDKYLQFQVLSGFKIVYNEPTLAIGLSGRFNNHFLPFLGFNMGAEMIFDGGIRRTITVENLNVDYKRFALTAGLDFFPGKFSVTEYLGIYLYSPYEKDDLIYEKFELSYGILRNFKTGIFLQTHLGSAELFGITVNYLLHL
jgi:hypothetical protein